MAIMVVCDIDQKPGAKTVTIEVDGKRYSKDLCDEHISEILAGAQETPRRGRPRKTQTTTASRGRGRQRKVP